jgi:hypothetical protein
MPGLYAAAGVNGLGLVLGLAGALLHGISAGDGAGVAARVPAPVVAGLAVDFPEVPAGRVERLTLRHDAVEAVEPIVLVPVGALHFPVLRGDPATALAEPGAIVLSRRLALKYFGSLDCLGRKLEIGDSAARVTAIAEDTLPATVGGFMAR